MIDRQVVYNKFGGRCAYCGNEITLKTMQVDHAKSKRNGGTDDYENLMPSCRLCNHYKRGGDIETLRWLIAGLLERLQRMYIFRVAISYGLVAKNEWDGKFYFEKIEVQE